MVGFAYGGTPANSSGTLEYLDGTAFSGFGFAGIAGLAKAYQSVADLLQTISTPLFKTDISAIIDKQCGQTDITAFAFQKLQSYLYTSAGPNLLSIPLVQSVASQNTLGVNKTETPAVPVYVYHALYDEIIPIADVDVMVSSFCSNGIKSLRYERDVGIAEHITMEFLGVANVINFLRDRFSGVPPVVGCQTSNVITTLTDPGALGTNLQIILGDIIDLLGGATG